MKILFVDQFGRLGGAQRCLLDLAPAFQREGWELRFAIAGEGSFTEELRAGGMEVHVLPDCALSKQHKGMRESVTYLNWHLKVTRALLTIEDEFKPELLYVNGPRLVPAAAFVAKSKKTPLLFHAHNRVLQPAARWSVGIHLHLTLARIIACCRYVADSLLTFISRAKIQTIYNGVPDLAKASRYSNARTPAIGVIGRIEAEKGQLDFVRAARLLHRKAPTYRFVVIGAPFLENNDGYLRQTIEESRDLPFTFVGWQHDIAEALRQLDVLVVPSFPHDATPRVIVEAFSAGVPVVAFASGGIPELIEDGRTGFLVQTRSPEALANRLLEVLRTKRELSRVVRNAREKWAANFRLDLYQNRVCDAIKELAMTT